MMKCYPPIDIERLNLMDCLGGSSPCARGCRLTHAAKSTLTHCTLTLLFSLATTLSATAQLRIVTYNTAGEAYLGSGTDRIDTVLKAIGEEIGNNGESGGNYASDGFAKPIDVLLLQEQNLPSNGAGVNHPSPTTQSILTLLNTAYAGQGVTYSMSNRTGTSDGAGTQTLIYRNETVELIGDTAFGAAGQDRQTLRFQLRPVGYTRLPIFTFTTVTTRQASTTRRPEQMRTSDTTKPMQFAIIRTHSAKALT